MKKYFVIIVIFIILFLILVVCGARNKKQGVEQNSKIEESNSISTNMEIISSAFANNQLIPSKYTCTGVNINPPLSIRNIPDGTQSLVLIVDDPDAPGGIWTHWLVWNISVDTMEISEGVIPEGSIQGKNDFGNNDYGGPCPPSGTHRYNFKIYALDSTLDLEEGSSKDKLEKSMQGKILGEAQLTGLFKK